MPTITRESALRAFLLHPRTSSFRVSYHSESLFSGKPKWYVSVKLKHEERSINDRTATDFSASSEFEEEAFQRVIDQLDAFMYEHGLT